jgi:beta-RFAP synthase
MTAPGVVVEAPARLHFGLLDLRGDLGRRFGGLGAALEAPRLVLEARPADTLSAEGPDRARVIEYASRVVESHRLPGGAALHVRETLPAHSGLGSGTQLALATARALAELHGLPHDAAALAGATGRAQRSAIGTWAFARGGFILEGGRRDGATSPAPLLLRHAMPESWRVVLAIPAVARGLSGAAEERAFRELPAPSADLTARASHVVLMQVLPALVEADLAAFGRGVTELQRLVGEMFRPVQGERFAHPLCAELVAELLAAGACGAGQSSWGPAVFGLVDGDAAAQALAARIRPRVGEAGRLLVSAFSNSGARVRPTG